MKELEKLQQENEQLRHENAQLKRDLDTLAARVWSEAEVELYDKYNKKLQQMDNQCEKQNPAK